MIWFFNWVARVAESSQDNDIPLLEKPTMNEINDDENGSIRMSHIGAAIIAANSEFPSSKVASSSTNIRDPIEMPVLRDESDRPEPYIAWNPYLYVFKVFAEKIYSNFVGTITIV